MDNRVTIVISALALVVSCVSIFVSYRSDRIATEANEIAAQSNHLARTTNEIAARELEANRPNFRAHHHVYTSLDIRESPAIRAQYSRIRSIPNRLYREAMTRNRSVERGDLYLWLIIENIGNFSAGCVELLSIEYSIGNQFQILVDKVAFQDNRWPEFPKDIMAREAVAILLHRISDQSKVKTIKPFKTKIKFTAGRECDDAKPLEFTSEEL